MKTLFRYLLKETYPPAFLALGIFSFILIINLFFQLAELVVEHGFSLLNGFLYFFSSLPALLSYTLPIAVLTGILVGVSRLSSDREIIAMRASGINISFMLFPFMALAFAVSLLLFLFNFYLVPFCGDLQEQLTNKAITAKTITRSLKPGEFFDKIPDVLIFVQDYNPKDESYNNILIYQNPKEGIEILTKAKSAKVLEDPKREEVGFIVKEGLSYTFKNKTPGLVESSSFQEQIIRLEGIKSSEPKKSDLIVMELPLLLQMAFGKEGDKLREDYYIYRYEFFRRIANSIVVFVFILLAFPLGVSEIGGGKGSSFSLSIILVLSYWVFQSGLGNLALKGKLTSLMGGFLPILIFSIISIPLNINGGEKIWRLKERVSHFPFFKKITTVTLEKRKKEKQSLFSFYFRKNLDIYLTKYNIRFFLLTLFALIILNFIVETRGFIGYLSNLKKIVLFVKYSFFRSIGLIPVLSSFALLISVLITCAVLERRSELTAIKASGISLFRISMTFIFISIIISFGVFLLQEAVIPGTNQKTIKIKDKIKNFYSRHLSSDEDVWLFSFEKKILYHYNYYDRKEKVFQGLSVYYFDEDLTFEKRFRAKRASFFEKQTIKFRQGWWWKVNSKDNFQFIERGKMQLPHTKDFLVLPEYIDSQTLSMKKLKRLINNLSQKGIKTTRLQVEYFKKLSEAFSCFVLVVIGLPFAFQGGRKGSLYGIFIALSLSLVFIVFSALMKSVGQMGWIDPFWAALSPSFLFTLTGFIALLKIRT